ncbi:MAG TPA: hypothetical protein VGT78_05400 [Rhizomicrobium sp.]|nr:hypothetical protein [Rhizomicrobium sp.]
MYSGSNVTNSSQPASVPRRSFPKLKERQRNTLPASKSRAVSGLETKYREMLGEKKKLQEAEYEWVGVNGYELAAKYYRERLYHLNSTLSHLEQSIRMFDTKWQRKRLMAPKVLKLGRPLLPKMQFQRALVRIFRSATEPLTVKDIAARIAFDLRLPMNRRDQRQRLWAMTYCSLRSNYDHGYVDCLDCKPAKWFAVASSNHLDGDFTSR